MKRIGRPVAALAAAGLVGVLTSQALAGGTVKASATFEGEKPKRTVIKMEADAYCNKANEKKVGSEDYLIKDDKIKNVVIYVKDGLGEATFETPTDKKTLDQVGCMYTPHVMTVQTGQTIEIKNSDDTLHNIHSLPKKQREFNFAQPKKGDTKEVDFKRDEIVKIKCDVHPWMSAYVAVFAHPFHAVTDEEGAATIDNLPPGEYTFAAWHEELGEVEQKGTVVEGEALELTFAFSK